MSHSDYTITVEGLKKSYGKLTVLDGINFKVERGSILALLGPNGAGKTTTVKILSTLLDADGGKATIEGYDVVKEADQVRSKIGLTGQYAAVDEYLTGEENLFMMGRLYRLGKDDAKRRTAELLTLVDLVDASKRPVRTYSGGMKRRLDLAMSLIANPPVIFLDEPTTGLDPRSRLAIWDMIKQLAKNGTSILLTTQYLEEADLLADNIIVIDGGKVIAEGTADSLKAKVGNDRLEIVISNSSAFQQASELLDSKTLQADKESHTLSIASKGVKHLKEVLQKFEDANIKVETVSLQRPTLDDVFLALTGHAATKEAEPKATPKSKGKK
ncbi:MAG TPA: ATP-binding cassette domain-containing protein [Candidatus Saccharimonadales bacterium]|nr:ATP-binding cassette domain-containing protein [Candidatus Saccharimonadales bacterium]